MVGVRVPQGQIEPFIAITESVPGEVDHHCSGRCTGGVANRAQDIFRGGSRAEHGYLVAGKAPHRGVPEQCGQSLRRSGRGG
ncbi:hypothetical protein ADK52_14245 [Streptomyces sp. WM6372]|nr:hypothetical protein ADK52_14245 [Streptomyces sp. WM6372]